jgi:formylglycine-generating enzyme required for sulfatase activity
MHRNAAIARTIRLTVIETVSGTAIALLLAALVILAGCTSSRHISHSAAEPPAGVGEMVYLPGGTFIMGADRDEPDERPAHTVTLSPFYIDICEVTVGQYNVFLDSTGRKKPAFWHPELDRPEDSVVGVTWHDAAAYAVWAGKRLPTEAEWEFAARGGTSGTRFPWGDDPDPRRANFASSGIAPVKRFPANGYGIHDMAGNVWEWCADWYDATYYQVSPASNPQGPATGTFKVLRGGAWYSHEDQIRITNRYNGLPDSSSFHNGFRCAKSAPEPER